MNKNNWRSDYNVLVPQADSMGAIAVIRSLGQHGYNVFATSEKKEALGCRSNYVKESAVSPAYNEEYLAWLRRYIIEKNIDVIIPSEAFYLIIKDHYQEFAHLLPITSNEQETYKCLCKVDVFQSFLEAKDTKLAQNIPNTKIITQNEHINWNEFKKWRFPLFLKGDAFYARESSDAKIVKVDTLDEAKLQIQSLLELFSKVMIQDCSSGVKATVNLLFQDGELLAESMALATHENPHTGGLTTLRHSWWQDDMYEDAIRRVKHLNWNGPAMVEYKWCHRKQSFSFIEINSRYWAALNLDILAGVHFPCVHLDYFFNKSIADKPARLTTDIVVRNALPADFGYMLSSLKDQEISMTKKTLIFIEFWLLFLNPRIKADLLYPGDNKLYFINLWNFTKELGKSCLKRLR
ncbi:hypothetical protein [Thalassotalea ganghwensis]